MRVEHLNGDDLIEHLLTRFVDDTHTSCADGADELVNFGKGRIHLFLSINGRAILWADGGGGWNLEVAGRARPSGKRSWCAGSVRINC